MFSLLMMFLFIKLFLILLYWFGNKKLNSFSLSFKTIAPKYKIITSIHFDYSHDMFQDNFMKT